MMKGQRGQIYQIIEDIENGNITDYDGVLYVYFMGKSTKYTYSIDEDYIIFPMAKYSLVEWLKGLVDRDDDAWTVEWANK